MTTTPKKPVQTLRRGRVALGLWKHENPKGTNYSFSLERRYKQNGEWKSTRGYFAEDTRDIAELVQEAATWVAAQRPPKKD